MKIKKYTHEMGEAFARMLADYGILPAEKWSVGHNYLFYLCEIMAKSEDYKAVKMSDCITQLAVEFDLTYNAVYMAISRVIKQKDLTVEFLFKLLKKEFLFKFKDEFDNVDEANEMKFLYGIGVWF